jgi:colanic acid/amylovoran biosynthesis protein
MPVASHAGSSDQARPLTIGLLWHTFLSENLGVGALTIANSNLIAEAAQKAGLRPAFKLIGSRGELDYSSECPFENSFTNIGYKALANPLSPLHRTMRGCDIVFDIGGGDSFSDIYPWWRFNLILGTKVAARMAGVPLVFSPQTIGPFFSRRARIAAKSVMGMASHIFARDEASYNVLEDMGMAAKSSLTTDVAFALPFTAPADKETRDLAAGPIKVGLNVSALLYRRDLSKGDKIAFADDYPALIDLLLERLMAIPRAEVHLVPHVLPANQPYEDDYPVTEALKARFPALHLPPRFTGPSQAKSYIAGLDLFLGSRMHATIAAISSNTAVLPLGYSRKFSGLFDSLGYSWNSDLTSETNEAVMARINAALTDLPGLRAQTMVANAEAQRRLGGYRDFLDATMAELARRHA